MILVEGIRSAILWVFNFVLRSTGIFSFFGGGHMEFWLQYFGWPLVQIRHFGRPVSSPFDISMAPRQVQHSLFLSSSDRTVKIWRARGGLDSTLEATDNADEVASNWKDATDWVMNPPMMLLPCTLTANCTARLTQHPELPKHTVSAQNIQSWQKT